MRIRRISSGASRLLSAAFFVEGIEKATTERTCLQGSQGWSPDFKVFEMTDNNWLGGSQWGQCTGHFMKTSAIS
jgi:hypothetical protein